MIIIILLILSGMTTGWLLRNSAIPRKTGTSISWTICLMLFILGVSVGENPLIIRNIGTFGWQALLLCCAGIAGSVLFAGIVCRLFFSDEKERER